MVRFLFVLVGPLLGLMKNFRGVSTGVLSSIIVLSTTASPQGSVSVALLLVLEDPEML